MSNRQKMHDDISRFFGKAGLDVQVGSTVIECEAPEGLSEWTSCNGVRVRVGDLIQTRLIEKGVVEEDWSEVVLVTDIFVENDDFAERAVVELGIRLPDDPDRLVVLWMPWRMGHEALSWTNPATKKKERFPGWHREVRQVSAEEYARLWEKQRTLKPGWHKLKTSAMEGQGRVHIGKDGVPIMVERFRTDFGIKTVLKVAEILTGYDLKLETHYCDDDKTRRRVKQATRRPPPKVGA